MSVHKGADTLDRLLWERWRGKVLRGGALCPGARNTATGRSYQAYIPDQGETHRAHNTSGSASYLPGVSDPSGPVLSLFTHGLTNPRDIIVSSEVRAEREDNAGAN